MKAMLPVLVSLLVLAGCATQKIDWQSRVGAYSFDQAVVDLGPPDKMAQLSDGTIVAEWLTFRGRSGHFYHGHHFLGHHSFHPFYEPPMPDRFLRLTFEPGGALRDWKRFAR